MSSWLRIVWWLPFAELAGLIWVGSKLGILFVLFWTLGTFLWGGSLLAGPARIEALQRALQTGQDELAIMTDQVVLSVAGLLLVFPGLITDAIGLFLLLPWTRKTAYTRLIAPFVSRIHMGPGGPFGPMDFEKGDIVDGEYQKIDRQLLSKKDIK